MDTAEKIKARVREIAKGLGRDARGLTDDEILPQSGLLDSAAILELIVWVETEFGIELNQDELSLDNFGSVRRMTEFIEARQA